MVKTIETGPVALTLSPQTSKKKSPPQPRPSPVLEEIFIRTTDQLTDALFIEEHLVKLDTMKKLQQAKLDALRSQLHLQLFQLWNDVWLQRQKVFDKAHKEWLKVFTA